MRRWPENRKWDGGDVTGTIRVEAEIPGRCPKNSPGWEVLRFDVPAREAYLKSLAIAERLAQAEPDRADYQRDLAVSHWRLGTEDDPAAEGHLRRALGVLMSMKETGRLDPVDEPHIEQLRELLRQRGFAGPLSAEGLAGRSLG